MTKSGKKNKESYGLFYISLIPGLIFSAVIAYNSKWFAAINTIWYGLWLLLFAHILTESKNEI